MPEELRKILSTASVVISSTGSNPMLRVPLSIETSQGILEASACFVMAKTWAKANPGLKAPVEGTKVKIYSISFPESSRDLVIKQFMAEFGMSEAQATKAYDMTHRKPTS